MAFSVTQQDPDSTPLNVQEWKGKGFKLYHHVKNYIGKGCSEDIGNGEEKSEAESCKQRRRLEEAGTEMDLLVNRDPRGVAECLREYGRLEEAGWKGFQGLPWERTVSSKVDFTRRIFENFIERMKALYINWPCRWKDRSQ
ncbi:MAG: hypothetical protein R3B95_10170 [Nitrospirales bacterium]|nr:hypothetical protein [Nitrospirales bacterium]